MKGWHKVGLSDGRGSEFIQGETLTANDTPWPIQSTWLMKCGGLEPPVVDTRSQSKRQQQQRCSCNVLLMFPDFQRFQWLYYFMDPGLNTQHSNKFY